MLLLREEFLQPEFILHSDLRRRTPLFWVRPKFGFGFGYGAETDLTYGFGLVLAKAKCTGTNSVSAETTRNLIALPPILLPRLTACLWVFKFLWACLTVSSVSPGNLRPRLWVVWFFGFSAHASFTSTDFYCRYSLVGSQFRFRLLLRP